ncbi:MAG TPA: hypothetical protein VGM78_07335 [Ilumatobacteraceae bacterium]
MAAQRSLTWRIVPWVVPLLLILVGLIFVVSSLSNSAKPSGIAAPPNVRDITKYDATGWAAAQAGAGMTANVIDVIVVSSKVIGRAATSTTYDVRALIARVDAPIQPPTTVATSVGSSSTSAPLDLSRTVVTCVRWTVDVHTGTIDPRSAAELSNTVGTQTVGNESALRKSCAAAALAP